jgi:hypothetical protein
MSVGDEVAKGGLLAEQFLDKGVFSRFRGQRTWLDARREVMVVGGGTQAQYMSQKGSRKPFGLSGANVLW